ncbi:MAG: tetratricopeptide repeat protein [Candidatus Lernaella stagnicola]|nr:tetratricopeptide repeat protein [Candidatus Lernaella stagnicola]
MKQRRLVKTLCGALAIGMMCLALTVAGCQTMLPAPQGVRTLPDDPSELMRIAETTFDRRGPTEAVWTSYQAACRVAAADPQNEAAQFMVARAASWLLEFTDNDFQRKDVAKAGYEAARCALELSDNKRGAYHFLAGANLGFALRESSAPHMGDVKHVRDYLQRAIELEPDYSRGAAFRALGMLLLYAPSWPMSVGDPDAAIDILRQAVQRYPDMPANWVMLAIAYSELGRKAEALAAAREAKMTLGADAGLWGVPGHRWQSRIDSLRAKFNGP